MTLFLWILAGGVAMSAIALVGGVSILLSQEALDRLLAPMIAFAAGSLIGGALFHMLPTAVSSGEAGLGVFAWCAAGFAAFFILEETLHYHHCRRAGAACRRPLGYLILIGDGLHNFLGGLAVAGAFIVDIRVGLAAWFAAALHEVPQELCDFGVLVHAGWSRRRALLFNLLSASTFLVGGLIAYFASFEFDVGFLVPFAAGNFLYIGASDLVPELMGHEGGRRSLNHVALFLAGLSSLFALGSLVH